MVFHKISSLVAVVILEIAVCSSTIDILHLKDEQQEDASSSIEKRSLKSGVISNSQNTVLINLNQRRKKCYVYIKFLGIGDQLDFPAWDERFHHEWKTRRKRSEC